MGENFSQKEILLQLINEIHEMRTELADQKILLQTHVNSSIDRDRRMNDLKIEVDGLKKIIGNMKDDIENLTNNFRFFRFKVTLIAGAAATVASFFGQRLMEYIF